MSIPCKLVLKEGGLYNFANHLLINTRFRIAQGGRFGYITILQIIPKCQGPQINS